MFTQAEYINGWLAYTAAAIICFWCWWYMVSKLPLKPLRPVLWGGMLGLLAMPWTVSPDTDYLAPAWLIAGSDGFFESLDAFWRAGTPLIAAVVVMATLALVAQIMWAIFSPKPESPRVTPTYKAVAR